MKKLIGMAMAATSMAAFATITVPTPDVTPAGDITWDDFGGATRNTTANWDAKDQTYSYMNGVFNMRNVSWQKGMTLNIGTNMEFNVTGAWHGPTGASTDLHVIRIFNGGRFDVKSDWDPNWTQLQVDQGGVFVFNPKSFVSNNSSSKQSWFDVYGELDAPAGLKATGNLRMDIITHPGSVIELGGDVTKNGNGGATLRWQILGGTIKATGDVAFSCSELNVAASALVSIDVDSGKRFDLTPFTIESGAAFSKTGAGEISIPSGVVLNVQDGVVVLSSAGSYDLSGVTFPSGSRISLGATGIAVAAYPSSMLTAVQEIALDAALVSDGVTVLTAPDAECAAWAATAVNAVIADGFEAVTDGLSVKVQTAFVSKTTTWTGAGDNGLWSTEDNWDNGKPVTGDNVVFGISSRAFATDNLANLTLSKVMFASNAPAYMLSGEETLAVLDEISNASAMAQTFDLPVALSGSAVDVNAVGDIVFKTLSSAGTLLTTTGPGTVVFDEGFAGSLAIATGGVKVARGKTLSQTAGALTVNGTLDLDGGTLDIVQPDSQIAVIGDGAVLTNGTFRHSSEKPVYVTNAQTGRAFMWEQGTWTIAKDATVVTSGYLFEFGPDAPAATYGERRIVIDGGELQSTFNGCKYVIGVDRDFSKPAVIELKNGALLKTTAASEFHIGARNSGTGSSFKAKGVVVANDATIELADQLRILNENNDSNSSGILAMTNSTLKLTRMDKIHELNATGKQWTDAQMILNNTVASFSQLQANARVGSGMSAGKMVGVLTLDGATLKPIKATDKFIFNNDAKVETIELQENGATIDTAYDVTIPAIAYGEGGFTKAGTGTLTLSATNTYTGTTKVDAGKLVLTGSVAGPLEVGADGTLAIAVKDGVPQLGGASALSFDKGAKIVIDLTGIAETKRYPFLCLPAEGTVSGTPAIEVVGSKVKSWAVVTRNTPDGVLCSIAPRLGTIFAIY